MKWYAWVLWGIAVLGAGLSLVHTFQNWNRRRVKLRVIPRLAVTKPDVGATSVMWSDGRYTPAEYLEGRDLCLEIINEGEFTVTVAEIGLWAGRRGPRLIQLAPIPRDGGRWPRRLEPRTSALVSFGEGLYTDKRVLLVRRAYVMTECNTVVYGTSKALENFIAITREWCETYERAIEDGDDEAIS